jgi:hypothetical protein
LAALLGKTFWLRPSWEKILPEPMTENTFFWFVTPCSWKIATFQRSKKPAETGGKLSLFLLICFLAYSSILKNEAIYISEIPS